MPVMGEVFTEQNEVTGLERADVIAYEAGTAAGSKQGEFHGGMEMPMVTFPGEAFGLRGRKQAIDVGNVFRPAEDPERVACWEMDLLTFAAHGNQNSTLPGCVKGWCETKVGVVETGGVENGACIR